MSHATATPTRNPLLGAGILLIIATFWSFYGVLVRMLGYNIPFFYGAGMRNVIAGLLLLIPLLLLKQTKSMPARDWAWAIARSVIGMLGMIGGYAGFFYLPMGTAYFVNFSGVVIGGFVFGKFLFQEKLTPLKIIGFCLALLGMALVYGVSFNPDTATYLWMTFLAGWGGAFWTVSSKKISDKYSGLQLNTIDFCTFGILATTISLLRHEVWSWPTATVPWLANLIFLVMFIITGQLIIVGFKHIDAQRGSLVLLLEVVLGSILGVVVFQEHLSSWAFVGGALILIAAALPEVGELLKERRKKVVVES